MALGAWLDLDLLRQRREKFGHRRPEVVPVTELLRRGSLIGASLPCVLLLICLWLWFSEMRLSQRAQELQPSAQRYDVLGQQLQSVDSELKALVAANQAIARSLGDVRSSSALLGELQRLIPETLSFDHAKVASNVLELKGVALQPNGLRTVNVLMLALARSGLFKPDAVLLKEAQLIDEPMNKKDAPGRLSYSITATFAPDAPQAIRDKLLDLGADGLHQRMRRLQEEEGLLK